MNLKSGDDIKLDPEKLIREWYRDHLYEKLKPMINAYARQLNLATPSYEVRELGKRWGSSVKNNRLYFHWQLARLPISKIEFICAHEIAHILEANHTLKFRKILAQLVPQHEFLLTKFSI